jgi:hypothetical protein
MKVDMNRTADLISALQAAIDDEDRYRHAIKAAIRNQEDCRKQLVVILGVDAVERLLSGVREDASVQG